MPAPSCNWQVQKKTAFGEIRAWKGVFHTHKFCYGSGKVINESDEYFHRGDKFFVLVLFRQWLT
jgi:hypothetical protein